jgi:enoyl-CoA hydratase / 3-hydroxyacyl-CoA dehydrogenase
MSQIKKIGVVGAGNMGNGIVQKIAQEGIPVVMVDIKDEFVQRGMNTIETTLREGIERKLFKPEQLEVILSRITGTTDFNAMADADIVIEAVFEDKHVKTEVFRKLDRICAAHTILATNTSSFYVKEFAAKTDRPDRFIGLHYFFHPAKNRLLEVIPHDTTSPETVEKSLLAARLHGKTAIVVRDAPGFAVNRFFVPFLNEAARILEDGITDIPTIEEAGKRAFKTGMGPFQLMNVTGVPIALHAATTLYNELGPFYKPTDILKQQVAKGENWTIDGEVDETKIDAVIDRFHGVCLGIAATLVDEGVAGIEDTDRGAKIGLRWALGPFEIMNRIGIDKTCRTVETITERYPDFKMPEILLKQKSLGKGFEFRLVDLEIKGSVAYLTLNRPEAMNALNEAVIDQLEKRFSEAERNPDVRAIVFQGAGKAFVAGADIRYFIKKIKSGSIPEIVAFTRKGHELLLRIEISPKLTIALLDGLSMGGGSELALSCRQIIATPAGSMAFPETGIGIYPGLGGMYRLARKIGKNLAKYFVFTGMPLNAEDAHALGIFDRVVEPSAVDAAIGELDSGKKPEKSDHGDVSGKFQPMIRLFDDKNIPSLLQGRLPGDADTAFAEKIVKYLGYKAPLALKIADEIMDEQRGKSSDKAIEIELGRLAEIFSTADALEGLSSLGRKRPEYGGK